MDRDTYVAVLKSAFTTIGRRFTMAWIAAKFPFLMIPGVKQLIEHFVGELWKDAADGGEFGAFILFVDLRVGGQKVDFEDSAYRNHWAQEHGTPEERARAEADLILKHRIFVHLKS